MTTAILRKWGGAVAVSLPKKILSMLDLEVGVQVDVKVEAGSIVLSPTRQSYSLTQLVREQKILERGKGGSLVDGGWSAGPKRGKEML